MLGNTQQTNQEIGLAASGVAATGAIIGSLAAIPIAGPIAAGVASLIVIASQFFQGCGETCIASSECANKIAQASGDILQGYSSQPVHYRSIQKQALDSQMQLWNTLVKCCQGVGGQGGSQCIADRQRGGKYDFFAAVYDPIANDPTVVEDITVSNTFSSLLPSIIENNNVGSIPWLPLALAGAGLLLFIGNRK